MKAKLFVFLLLTSFLLAGLPNTSQAAVGADFWITDATLVIEGNRPSSSVLLSVPLATYNATQTLVLDSYSWDADDLSPADLKATGVSKKYSSDFAGQVLLPPSASMSSARGIYSTLRVTDESSFVEQTLKTDLDVQTFYTLDSIYETINTTMLAYGLTAENFTAETCKIRLTFDKSLVDSFFADVAADSMYDSVATEYYTDTSMVADLFEDYFRETMLDLVYTKVNLTDYATTDDIATEMEDVLGGNATDTSLDGATIIGSIRNAAVGFIGLQLAEETTISADVTPKAAVNHNTDRFVHFEATDDSYIIDFSIFSDFISGSKIIQNFGLAIAQIFPHTTTASGSIAFPLYVHLIVIAIIGLAAGLIGYATTDGKKKKKRNFWKTFGIAAGVTAIVMFLGFPVSSIF